MSYRKISCVIKRKKRLIKIRIGENVIKLKFFNLTFTLPVFSFLNCFENLIVLPLSKSQKLFFY